ncbi:MAG: DUF1292 domain-containing protein [Bacillota bacterium]|nr:DUF1292 domain-containing protein [Bacillota bacterium]
MDELFQVVEPDQDRIVLNDENGNPVVFHIIANLYVDEQEYAILMEETSEDEVVIFKVTEDGEEYIFESVESQEELDAVMEAYNELLEESEE